MGSSADRQLSLAAFDAICAFKFLAKPLLPAIGPLEPPKSFSYVPLKTETPSKILLQRNQKTDSATQSAAIDEIMQELDALKEKLESLRTKID